ncbi:MAG: Ig-like domain-containing protein [Anaerolineales bacterium]
MWAINQPLTPDQRHASIIPGMNWRLVLGVVAVAILVGLVLVLRANLPSVTLVSPADGDIRVAIGSPIKLAFSEAMQPESVEQNLIIQPSVPGSFSWGENTLTFTPEQPWPSGEQIDVTLEAGARTRLGLPMINGQGWSFSINPPLLVYLWPADEPADLYTIDLEDSSAARLTEQPNGILSYDISISGRQIFYSTRITNQNSAIFRIDRMKESITQILGCTNVLCDFPKLSPQGDYLAYTRAPSNPSSETFPQQVWLLPIIDGEPLAESQARLVSDPLHSVGVPFWSPNGLLTFHDKDLQQFVVLDPMSNELLFFPNETGEAGTWSPDSSNFIVHEVEFWGDGPLDYTSHLWRFEYPSTLSSDLSQDPTVEDVTPAYSPDGKLIAFGRRYLDPNRFIIGSQIWMMRADGSFPQQITDNPDYNHADFAWKPDGRQLAFVRHKQTTLIDPPEIWITLPDGSDAVRLVIGGYAPAWIP